MTDHLDAPCGKTGNRSPIVGSDHNDAVALLSRVDKTLGNHLRRLLQMKPKAQYSALAVSNQELKTSQRASDALIAAARDA